MSKENQKHLQFCKIFQSEKFGQIVIVIDESCEDDMEDTPVFVCSIFYPDVGVISMENPFEPEMDPEKSWSLAEEMFENMTLEMAEGFAGKLFDLTTEEISISKEKPQEEASGFSFKDFGASSKVFH